MDGKYIFNIINSWGNVSVWILQRIILDRCLLILNGGNRGWSQKPLRFNNF